MGTFEGECSHFAKNQSEVEELIEQKVSNGIIWKTRSFKQSALINEYRVQQIPKDVRRFAERCTYEGSKKLS